MIIPAYNEERRLPKTLQAIDKYLRKQSYNYEILVVNAGSQDKTKEIVEAMMPNIKNLRLLTIENRGKGYAVKQGMLEAIGEFRLFTDADNSTGIEHVEKMWREFERGFDMVIGSRDVKGAHIAVLQSWWRRRLGDMFNIMVQLISGLRGMWDTQCGFKGFTRKAAQSIFEKSVINGWAFDVELLILAKNLGYKTKEIPVTWVNDPESKVNVRGMVQMLWDIFAIRKNMMQKRYG